MRFKLLSFLLGFVGILSFGCEDRLPRCKADSDCPSDAYCYMKLELCFDRSDSGMDVGSSVEPEALSVTIKIPESTAYASKSIAFELLVTGQPDRVEILKAGEPWLDVSFPYLYTWDVTGVLDDVYEISARASRGDEHVSSPARLVVVDHASP